MKNYIVLLQDKENLLRTLSAQKAKDIRTQHYQAAGLVRDQERKILDEAKELLMDMKVDIEGLPPDSSEKLELMKVFQNYMEDFGFDNTKRIEALQERNKVLNADLESLRREKYLLLAFHKFSEANIIRDKMVVLEEEIAKNAREIRKMQGF